MHTKFHLMRKYWWVVVPCLALAALFVLPSGSVLAQDGEGDDGNEPRSPDECANCHEDEYQIWQESQHANALADPIFIEAWERAGNPTYCKSCHATGYDAVEGTVGYEGVGCLACHEDAEGNHPGSDMTVDNSSELCGSCHTGTHAPDYDQWLVSDHATMNIGCADCHQSHNTALHFDDNPTELCGSCHQGLDEDTHGSQGMACHDCHMAAGDEVVDPLSGQTNGAGHTFGIPANVCSNCHGMTHSLAADGTMATVDLPEDNADQCEAAKEQANRQLNLGLTGGGISGLIIGIAVPWLLHRREQK